MCTLKWLSSCRSRMFGTLLFACMVFAILQYKNYRSSILYCSVARHVEPRRIEVYNHKLVESDENLTRASNVIEENDVESAIKFIALPQVCKPKKYVMFLKTHKTGSSTITNILNRYADKNDMTILLPKMAAYYSFDWPNKFRLSFAMDTFRRPNFLANHARYSRKSMNVMFPRASTTYVSILRHPVSQWESTFQYMSFPYILGVTNKEDPLDFFLNNFPTPENIVEVARSFPSLYLIRNPLFFDLGLDHRHYDNATFIRRALKTLDDDFELVLIMEHFDESLTLLRRRLCWDIDDVVYFKMNERLNKHKRRRLTPSQIAKIQVWNSADMALYNHFVEKFWRQVSNEGSSFYDDVTELRRRQKYYSNLCIEREAVEEAYSSVFVKGYKMRTNLTGSVRTFCERMLKNELHFMDYFRTKRAKMTRRIEGVNIENFEQATEELDVPVEMVKVPTSSFIYGNSEWKTKKRKKEKIRKSNQSPYALNKRYDKSNLGSYRAIGVVGHRKRMQRGRSKVAQNKKKSSAKRSIHELSVTSSAEQSDDADMTNNWESSGIDAGVKYDGKTIMSTQSDIELV